MAIHPSVHQSIHPSTPIRTNTGISLCLNNYGTVDASTLDNLSIYPLSIYPCGYQSFYPSIHPSIHPPTHPASRLASQPSILHPSIHPSIHPSTLQYHLSTLSEPDLSIRSDLSALSILSGLGNTCQNTQIISREHVCASTRTQERKRERERNKKKEKVPARKPTGVRARVRARVCVCVCADVHAMRATYDTDTHRHTCGTCKYMSFGRSLQPNACTVI